MIDSIRKAFSRPKTRERSSDIQITRYGFYPLSTLGELTFKDGDFFCHTLEDPIRAYGVKIPGWTALPAGWYRVKKTYSPRFEKIMPLIYTEPDYSIEAGGIQFTGVRFHGGNDHFDTDGCVMVSLHKKESFSSVEINGETRRAEDVLTWGSMVEELNDTLEDGVVYSLLITNEI